MRVHTKGVCIVRKGLHQALQSSPTNVTHLNSSNIHIKFHFDRNNPWHHYSMGGKFDKHNKQQQIIRAIYQNIQGLSATQDASNMKTKLTSLEMPELAPDIIMLGKTNCFWRNCTICKLNDRILKKKRIVN